MTSLGPASARLKPCPEADIWVNNAMTTVFSLFTEITPDEFKRATEVTYLGAVYGTMAALKSMIPRNKGSIVQVGSALAYRSIALQAPYRGAKHAIAGFTDTVRTELIHDKRDIHLTMVQMPALNAPQFSWCKTRLPRRPQPVPPIFQPEVAAEAIVWAAHHRPREVYGGLPTVEAIEGNKIAPGWLDRYLGRTGYDTQQTDQPVSPNRPNNLFKPLSGDPGAHGNFDSVARECRRQLWVTTHRGWLVLAGIGIAGAALGSLAELKPHETCREKSGTSRGTWPGVAPGFGCVFDAPAPNRWIVNRFDGVIALYQIGILNRKVE
jgi:short-subunit dehydrogenase